MKFDLFLVLSAALDLILKSTLDMWLAVGVVQRIALDAEFLKQLMLLGSENDGARDDSSRLVRLLRLARLARGLEKALAAS